MNQQEFIAEFERIVMADEGTVSTDSALKDLKWDSMAALEYQALADEQFGMQLEPTAISIAVTVGDLCKLVKLES